ncbi:MAG: L,D-transpeptidase family protein, partial [Gemmatimonadota bacterium]
REAVLRFQGRHGLDADGVVGGSTIAALNVPAEDRASQIEVNLERWRWLPADLGSRHIEVNIAGFGVEVVDRGRPVLRLRAIVGRHYTQTPSFSATLRYLVFAPFWHVPWSIAVREEFPRFQRDPGLLAAERFMLIDRETNEPVDPTTVEWAASTPAQLAARYRLRQSPGSRNALGRVKFMFPNPFDVYLHDTPGRELFARTTRAFSHGCIRVERPLDLAAFLLESQGWTRERILGAAEGTEETTVVLDRPLPVHVLYWTAWIDPAEGTLHFREDVYGRDERVLQALAAPAPGS